MISKEQYFEQRMVNRGFHKGAQGEYTKVTSEGRFIEWTKESHNLTLERSASDAEYDKEYTEPLRIAKLNQQATEAIDIVRNILKAKDNNDKHSEQLYHYDLLKFCNDNNYDKQNTFCSAVKWLVDNEGYIIPKEATA